MQSSAANRRSRRPSPCAHFLQRTFDAHLPAQRLPMEQQRPPAIGADLARPLRLSALGRTPNPSGPCSLSSTMRTEGAPSGVAVASAIGVGIVGARQARAVGEPGRRTARRDRRAEWLPAARRVRAGPYAAALIAAPRGGKGRLPATIALPWLTHHGRSLRDPGRATHREPRRTSQSAYRKLATGASPRSQRGQPARRPNAFRSDPRLRPAVRQGQARAVRPRRDRRRW